MFDLPPKALWFATRGSGIVTLLLLTLVTALGILNAMHWRPKRLPLFVLQGIHRNISLVSVVFLVIHISTTVVDGYVDINWVDAFVPFLAGHEAMWTGLGTLTVDLLVATIVTSLLKHHLSPRLWRFVHWFAYLSWPTAVVHGIALGSDSATPWMISIYAGQAAVILAILVRRFRTRGAAGNQVAIDQGTTAWLSTQASAS